MDSFRPGIGLFEHEGMDDPIEMSLEHLVHLHDFLDARRLDLVQPRCQSLFGLYDLASMEKSFQILTTCSSFTSLPMGLLHGLEEDVLFFSSILWLLPSSQTAVF